MQRTRKINLNGNKRPNRQNNLVFFHISAINRHSYLVSQGVSQSVSQLVKLFIF